MRWHTSLFFIIFTSRRRGLDSRLKTLGDFLCNDSENVDLHRHFIYQNDPMAKPDFMVIVPDLYRRRRRRQARRRLPSLPPEPQGHLKNAFYVPKQLTKFANLLYMLLTITFAHLILTWTYHILAIIANRHKGTCTMHIEHSYLDIIYINMDLWHNFKTTHHN